MPTKNIKLVDIKVDKNIQPRVSLNQHTVNDYTERVKAGDEFPPIVVFDDGKVLWLADGFHRFKAHKELKRATISADVRKGKKRDALWFSTGANAHHGARLTRADKRKVLEVVLKDREWAKISNREIAAHIGCSEGLVRIVITESENERDTKKTVTRNGKELEQETEAIGATPEKPKKEDPPESPTTPATSWSAEDHEEEEPVNPPTAPIGNPVSKQKDISELPFHARSTALRGLSILAEALLAVRHKGYFQSDSCIDLLLDEVADPIKAARQAIDTATKQDVSKQTKFIREWMEEGRAKATGTGGQSKGKVANGEAKECVDLWEELIGFPPTAKEGDKVKYGKELEKIVTIDGQDWGVVKEVIHGAKICWVDEGIAIMSPLGIRKSVKSGACKKWESIWESYRKHLNYKPLRPVPKCPECGKGLQKGNMTQRGRAYSVYMCPAHQKESIKLGKQYMPQQLIK
jgi:hypothetical protein